MLGPGDSVPGQFTQHGLEYPFPVFLPAGRWLMGKVSQSKLSPAGLIIHRARQGAATSTPLTYPRIQELLPE